MCFRAYEEAISNYRQSVAELRRNTGVMSKEKYQEHYRRTERLRLHAVRIEEIYKKHVEEHGCAAGLDTWGVVNL